uniref:Cytochrome c oxidase subunit 6, mitochondrial n=1 Tax=Moniliophthora roreri TaxID=221103 RepID=A0A0W0FU45_MONRR
MMRPIVSNALRAAARPSFASASRSAPILTRQAHGHAQESFEEFSERYVNFFQNAEDLFELQREAAVRAARRVNDYSTAVRIFEGIKEKVENVTQYQAYLEELKGLREELGISTKEELYPGSK